MGIVGIFLAGCSNSEFGKTELEEIELEKTVLMEQKIMFEKTTFDITKDLIECNFFTTQSISSDSIYDIDTNKEIINIRNSQPDVKESTGMVVKFKNLLTDSPKIIGDIEADLIPLHQDNPYKTSLIFLEKNPINYGSIVVYNFSKKDGTVIWIKTYDVNNPYAITSVGHCK